MMGLLSGSELFLVYNRESVTRLDPGLQPEEDGDRRSEILCFFLTVQLCGTDFENDMKTPSGGERIIDTCAFG